MNFILEKQGICKIHICSFCKDACHRYIKKKSIKKYLKDEIMSLLKIFYDVSAIRCCLRNSKIYIYIIRNAVVRREDLV